MASTEQIGLNKTWELSLYELHRTPQDAIVDNTEIAVSPRSLHSELMCPICLDMLKKTMTTKVYRKSIRFARNYLKWRGNQDL